MTGKRYYISTLTDWQRHAGRFSNSHWFSLTPAEAESGGAVRTRPNESTNSNPPIIVIVEADKGAHLALEDDPAFEALPDPFSQRPISDRALAALAGFNLRPGATTLEVSELLGRLHPLLRHRVF